MKVRVALAVVMVLAGCSRSEPFDLASTLTALQREMMQPGTGEQSALRAKVQALFAREHVLEDFKAIYGQTPVAERWYLLQLAGFALRPDTVAFLAEVAREPAAIARVDRAGGDHQASSDLVAAERNRMAAARGVTGAALQRVPGAMDEATSLLAQAQTGVAQWVGVELYTHNSFSDGQRGVLGQRGIGTNFQPMSSEQWNRMTQLEPTHDARSTQGER